MLYWSFFINRYVKMGLQFSSCPRVYRDDRYFNDLISQLSVFRDENTEAQRLKRFTPDHITQVIAGRARLEPDHWTPGALSPGPCDLRALFRCLTSPVFFRLKLYVINGLVLSTYDVSFFLFFMVNLWNYIILKSYVIWTHDFCVVCSLLSLQPPPLTTSVWWTHTYNQGSSPLHVCVPSKAFPGQSPPLTPGSLFFLCTLATVHVCVAMSTLYIVLCLFIHSFIYISLSPFP